MQKLRQISFGGKVRYQKQFNDIAEADTWYAKMQAKPDFLPEHTVEDVDNPEVLKRVKFRDKLNTIKNGTAVESRQATYEILKFLAKDHFDEEE